jgi:hypothetical protein
MGIALLGVVMSLRMFSVAARRSRSAILGALLAWLAVLGVFSLSTWHSADFHDHEPAHVASVVQVHDQQAPDPDSAIHVAAHMVGHSIAVPGATVASAASAALATRWQRDRSELRRGLDPTSLLRPPRA